MELTLVTALLLMISSILDLIKCPKCFKVVLLSFTVMLAAVNIFLIVKEELEEEYDCYECQRDTQVQKAIGR